MRVHSTQHYAVYELIIKLNFGPKFRPPAVAIEDIPSGDAEGERNGFKLIGLLPIYDPPRSYTKETIDRALEPGKNTFLYC